jgi:hypothetical protein
MMMVTVVLVRLRWLRGGEGCETERRDSRKCSKSFGPSSHGEPYVVRVRLRLFA